MDKTYYIISGLRFNKLDKAKKAIIKFIKKGILKPNSFIYEISDTNILIDIDKELSEAKNG